MTDLDYELALKLQFELQNPPSYESEDKKIALLLQEQLRRENTKNHDADKRVALLLQEQFNKEEELNRSTNALSYDHKKVADTSKCLVDPSWELVDPTPNIHVLFVAFDEQFFWKNLGTVDVSWNKRMTSCAGVCTYQPRGQRCSITLSEPLLKLRPRKDLVETLLHEMIHAYLFVTHNNRDRDGHGPEFHKHMHRINKDAGTNITVYHNFHDEVRLYKQHWWKCNGPCQHRKPFYGMVRRAMNLAPGPNDRWWKEHETTCGGQFIKVKEPDKPEKKVKPSKKPPPIPTADIRNYLPTTNGDAKPPMKHPPVITTPVKKSPVKKKTVPSPNHDIRNFFPSNGTPSPNQKRLFGDDFAGTVKAAGKVTDNHKNNTFNNNAQIKNIHGFHDIDNIKTPQPSTSVFSGKGNTLTTSNGNSSKNYEDVRNSWINKYDDKRPSDEHATNLSKKTCISCPVCAVQIPQETLNDHLDVCLAQGSNATETCVVCDEQVPAKQIESHTRECLRLKFETDDFYINCDICDEPFTAEMLPEHKKSCLQNISVQLLNDSNDFKECEFCKAFIDDNIYEKHVNTCCLKLVQEMYADSKADDETIACLVCKKKVSKGLLNDHLDECMNESVFLNRGEVGTEIFRSQEEISDFLSDNSLIEDYDKNKSS